MNEEQLKAGVNIFSNFDESFQRLPVTLQEKSIAMSRAFKRVLLARKQSTLWQVEARLAEEAVKLAQAEHTEALNRWDPDTNTMTALEDAPEKSA